MCKYKFENPESKLRVKRRNDHEVGNPNGDEQSLLCSLCAIYATSLRGALCWLHGVLTLFEMGIMYTQFLCYRLFLVCCIVQMSGCGLHTDTCPKWFIVTNIFIASFSNIVSLHATFLSFCQASASSFGWHEMGRIYNYIHECMVCLVGRGLFDFVIQSTFVILS
jgi:hypothetical protein